MNPSDLVIEKKPYSRGVSQLMYVGDDDAVDNELTRPNERALALCQIGLGVAVFGLLTGNRRVRNAGAVIAVGGFLAI